MIREMYIVTKLQLLICSVSIEVAHAYKSNSSKVCSEFVVRKLSYVPDDMKDFKGICPSSCPMLKPHIVVSEWGNGTFLACAQSKPMFGHCVEFNSGSQTIQAHQSKCGYCRNFSNPCPPRYNSTESYKFRECFTGCGGLKTSKETSEHSQNYSLQLEDKYKEIAALEAKNIQQGVSSLKDKNKIEAFQDEIAILKPTMIILIVITVLLVCLYCKREVILHRLYKYYKKSGKHASGNVDRGTDIEAANMALLKWKTET